ncbi:MAG: cytochrome c biogenesis protein CcdA [bacterium]
MQVAYKDKKLIFSAFFIFLLLIISDIGTKKLNCLNSNRSTTQTIEKSFFSIDNLKETFSPEKSPFYLIILAFLVGILTSFTPCVYPMIPITLGILQTQASTSLSRNFLLALSYVLGISTVYAILGYVAATTTVIFGQWLSNPWLVLFISIFFIYLAFSMFGFYEIKIPNFLTKRDNVKVKGSFIYSFIFGAISGTVASPCLTPAIAILLSFVAKLGSPIIGFLTLFFFALGMGILLIVIGTFSTSLNVLPRAGMWMVEVKIFFGFVLLAMSIYFFQPFLGGNAGLKAYATLCLIAGMYYLIKSNQNKIKISFGILLIILSIFLISWGIKQKHSKLSVSNLKPDKLLVALSTSKHQRI